MLTSEESRAHELIRHLADYVLVWAGGGGDDLAKSPHMARIGNSVYPDICPGDPLCYSLSINPETVRRATMWGCEASWGGEGGREGACPVSPHDEHWQLRQP
eukprot:365392-Chlamydomonas_euryale.AAC.4